MKILVVDDQQCQIDLMTSLLSNAGYEVIGCRSGQEAVDRLRSHRVDILITDTEMGGLNGEDVLKFVRNRFGSMPVILMSGNPGNLKRKGFDGYLQKPFLMKELLSAVRKVL